MLESHKIIEVVKGGEYPLLLTEDVYKGEKRYDLRSYYRKMDNLPAEYQEQHRAFMASGEFSPVGLMPTKKGVSMTVDTFLILQEAMSKVAESILPSATPKAGKK
jgi:hypothetical protein